MSHSLLVARTSLLVDRAFAFLLTWQKLQHNAMAEGVVFGDLYLIVCLRNNAST